ncbi:MAG: MBL fold metallo-hydrolase [Methanobacterium sp.]
MKLQILYDNDAKNNFKAGWGFSCFIAVNEKKILFDTGWNGFVLLNNMEAAGINPEKIDIIVISHQHWDHIGGLNHVLEYTRNPDVYFPESVSENLKNEVKNQANIVEVSQARKVCDNIYTTGELGEKIKEQSLILCSKKGNIVLTGCAHPGLEAIIKKSRQFGEIYGVVGGFHDSNVNILKGTPLIIPCHCTQKKGEIKTKMSESYKNCEVGYEYDI